MNIKKTLFVFFLLIFLPLNVKALNVSTEIIGNKSASHGDTIFYTIIVDQPLNVYKSEIKYDRNVLNLINVNEVNINTTKKKFEVDRSDSIVIDINSEEVSNIVYTLEFKVKNYSKLKNTKLSLKTLIAKTSEENFTSTEDYVDIDIVENNNEGDYEVDDSDNKITLMVNNIKRLLNNYRDNILYISIFINIVMFIILLINFKRKKVDYDF